MEIRTDMLITLCHILDNFEEFRRDLRVLVEKKNLNILFILSALAEGKYVLGNREAKKFYQEYKTTIDTINNGSCPITLFLSFVVSQDTLYNLDFFYKYLMKQKSELDKILMLLEKIKILEIETIKFTEETFTDKIWELYSEPYNYNYDFYFMENMVVVPNYMKNIYKTTGTHYLMRVYSVNEHITCREISINSLTFDESLLPNDLSKENTYDKIMEVVNSDESTQYRSDMDDILKLDLSLDEMVKNYQTLYANIFNLKRVAGKEELKQVLEKLNENMAKLKNLQVKYNQSIVNDNPLITYDVIDREKTQYLKRLKDID